jgi:hypothetical protein
MKDLGYGKGYEMYGEEPYLPEKLKNTRYFKDSEGSGGAQT